MSLTFEKTDQVPYVHWVVSLSDGSLVYQDIDPSRSCWSELKRYVKAKNLKIMNLLLEGSSLITKTEPYLNSHGKPQVQGFWFSNKISSFIGANAGQAVYTGIGHVKDGNIHIRWLHPNNSITTEIRQVNPEDAAIIWNDKV